MAVFMRLLVGDTGIADKTANRNERKLLISPYFD